MSTTTMSGGSDDRDRTPSLFGMPLKYVSLVTLALQNALLIIVMHYSRVSASPSKAYSAASAVLLNELLKGSISLFIAFSNVNASSSIVPSISDKGHYPVPPPPTISSKLLKLSREIFSPDCWKLSIPAILYVIQNNLQFVAASNLDVATFQVTYQMKILTTAAFSVVLLRKKLTPAKWLALLGLAVGVGIVQIQSGSTSSASTSSTMQAHERLMSPLKGFLAVSLACMTSGLAGVYFEMVLKNSQADLWVRNVQLSLFSLLPALAPIVVAFFTAPSTSSFSLFENFTPWAWLTVLIQVFGGLVTAVVIKYSDNILKGFATSLSIIISFLASVAIFNFHITPAFVVGAAVVLGATWVYNQPGKEAASASVLKGVNGVGAIEEGEELLEKDAPILGYPQKRTNSLGSIASALGLSRNNSAASSIDLTGSFTNGNGNGNGVHVNGYTSSPNGSMPTTPATPIYFHAGHSNGNGSVGSTKSG